MFSSDENFNVRMQLWNQLSYNKDQAIYKNKSRDEHFQTQIRLRLSYGSIVSQCSFKVHFQTQIRLRLSYGSIVSQCSFKVRCFLHSAHSCARTRAEAYLILLYQTNNLIFILKYGLLHVV